MTTVLLTGTGLEAWYELGGPGGGDYFIGERTVTLTVDISDDHMLTSTEDGLRTSLGTISGLAVTFLPLGIVGRVDYNAASFADLAEEISGVYAEESISITALRYDVLDTPTDAIYFNHTYNDIGGFYYQEIYEGWFVLSGPSLTLDQFRETSGTEITDGPYADGTDFSLFDADAVIFPEPPVDGLPDTALVVQGIDMADTLTGEGGNDTISGLEGDDLISGGGGDDLLAGGPGNDVVNGDSGNDNMGGGTGNDTMDGGFGDDTMGAGFGDDNMLGGVGDDGVFGGAGDDSLIGGFGDDTMAGSYGDDTVLGSSGNDDMGGGSGKDILNGGYGNDTIGGGEGGDEVYGGGGNDFIAGGRGNDLMRGGDGNDEINGGRGNDIMTGGAGNDVFIFTEFTEGERDRITDWTNGHDLIRLTGITNAPNSGLQGRVDALDITATAGGVEFSFEGHTVFLQGASADDLGVEDFIFV